MATENQSVKSKRDTFRDRYKGMHPDANLDDEEGVYGGISDDYDNYENKINTLSSENERYKKDQEDFIGRLTENENNGRYMDGLMNGKDFLETAIEIHGYDGLMEYLDSEEAREKYKAADEKKKADLARSKEIDAEAEMNAKQTDKDLQAAIEAGRFTEEECKSALQGLFDMADGLAVNVCKPEWVEMYMKAQNHDADVESASAKAKLDGVNEGVNKQMRKRANGGAGAGQPQMPVGMGGGSGNGQSRKRGDGSLSSLLMG